MQDEREAIVNTLQFLFLPQLLQLTKEIILLTVLGESKSLYIKWLRMWSFLLPSILNACELSRGQS